MCNRECEDLRMFKYSPSRLVQAGYKCLLCLHVMGMGDHNGSLGQMNYSWSHTSGFSRLFLFKYLLFKFILPGNSTEILSHGFFYGGAYNNLCISCHINCTSVAWGILIFQLLKRMQLGWSNLGILNLSLELFLHSQDWEAELFSS